MGTQQMGKSPAVPPPIWKKPVYEEHHHFDTRDHYVRFVFAHDDLGGEEVAAGTVFPGGANDGDVLFAGGQHPAVFRVDFIILFQHAAAEDLIEELVGHIALAFCLGFVPNFHQVFLDTAESLFFRDAGIRDTAVVVVQKVLFFLGSEVPVAGDAIVVAVGHQVEDVFLQVVGAAADEGDLVPADHLGQGDTEFCGGHGSGHGEEHLAALVKELFIGLGGVYEGSGIEMTVVVGDEL